MRTKRFHSQLVIRMFAVVASLAALFTFMFFPLLLVLIILKIPLNDPGPNWGIWILIVGGGLGAGAARLTHHLILSKFAGADQNEIDDHWYGKKKLSPIPYGFLTAIWGGCILGIFYVVYL